MVWFFRLVLVVVFGCANERLKGAAARPGAASIALQAIWANKLRSLLTVLGNIVAVTSIIAVVSLVQGLNASVKDAIQSQVGADTFVTASLFDLSERRAAHEQIIPRTLGQHR